jgi:hypothetical protein
MLRINYVQSETERRWTLCGHLAGAWVPELHDFWEQTRRGAAGLRAVVDLSDVTFIDESGERLLQEMCNSGVEFFAAGVDTKHLLENLKGDDERPLRRLISPMARGCDQPHRAMKQIEEETNEKHA